MQEPHTKTFRLQAIKLFFTWSQHDVGPLAAAIMMIVNWFGKDMVDHVVLCKEDHKDEKGVHSHAYVKLKKKINVRNARWFDAIFFHHPSVEAAKTPQKALAYVMKDGDYVSWPKEFDPKAFLNALEGKKSSKMTTLVTMIMQGKSLLECCHAYPGVFADKLSKLQTFEAWWTTINDNIKLDWHEIELGQFLPEHIEIAIWLNANIKHKRKLKQKQLFIHGQTNMGKSSLVEWLAQYLRIFYMPSEETFMDMYHDNEYDLIVLDEFKGGLPITHLNKLLDGQTFNLRIKGGQVVKKNKLPMIVLAQDDIDTYYSYTSAYTREAFKARFTIVNPTTFIKIREAPPPDDITQMDTTPINIGTEDDDLFAITDSPPSSPTLSQKLYQIHKF